MLPCWLSLLGKPANTSVPGSGFSRVTEMPSVPLPLTPLPGNPPVVHTPANHYE